MQRLLLAVLLAFAVVWIDGVRADVFKYMDGKGNIYFTDAPLKGGRYRLVWKRESQKLVEENRQRLQQTVAQTRPSKRLSERRARYERLILSNAQRYGLLPELLHAVIRAESAYNPGAVSHAGAEGLMQLMPATAKRYGVRDSFDPAQNVRGGAAYLRDLLDMFDQDLRLALAGYNAGENAVIKYGRRIPPYSETESYVKIVLGHLWSELGTRATMSRP